MQAGPGLWRNITDDAAHAAALRAHNDWLGEEYCAVNSNRLIGLGVMPMTNIEDALAELHTAPRLVSRASCSARFPNGMAYPQPEDDRFWAAVLDMQMPLTVHVAFNRAGERAQQPNVQVPGRKP